MQPTQPVFVGVDVSKATLSVAIHGSKTRHELSNEAHAICAWLDTLPLDVAIAAEATGRYHQLLIRLVHASGRRAFVLNAADVFFYAKALGARGKNDRKDAQVIAPGTWPSSTRSFGRGRLRKSTWRRSRSCFAVAPEWPPSAPA